MRISIKNFMPNLWMDLMWIYSTNRNPLIWKHRLRTWRKRAISNRTSNGSTDWAISSRLKYARWVEQVQIQLFISIHTNIDTREAIEKKKKKNYRFSVSSIQKRNNESEWLSIGSKQPVSASTSAISTPWWRSSLVWTYHRYLVWRKR